MSIALLTVLALLNPAFAADEDEIVWDDLASAAAPDADDDEPDDDEPDGDEPDDDDVDDIPTVVKRTTTTTVSTTPKSDDDFQFDEPAVVAVVAPVVKVGPVTLDVVGKVPLADNYPAAIVAVDRDDVVVELPILVAKSRADAAPFVLIAQAYIGTAKVGEMRQSFEAASLAESGPTFAFVKMLVPVGAPTGDVKIVVSKAKPDGTGAAELFSKTVPYSLM